MWISEVLAKCRSDQIRIRLLLVEKHLQWCWMNCFSSLNIFKTGIQGSQNVKSTEAKEQE